MLKIPAFYFTLQKPQLAPIKIHKNRFYCSISQVHTNVGVAQHTSSEIRALGQTRENAITTSIMKKYSLLNVGFKHSLTE